MSRSVFFNPFILAAVVAGLAGNLSLGLVTSGFTILVWGTGAGVFFVTLTTLGLVLLTGNINFEIIFIYCLTIAFLIRESFFLSRYDKRYLYLGAGLISILSYPLWSNLLGLLPVSLLNDLNIAGELILAAGLIRVLLQGIDLIRDKKRKGELVGLLLVTAAAAGGIMGSWLALPFSLAGFYVYQQAAETKPITSTLQAPIGVGLLALLVMIFYLILPLNIYLASLLVFLFFLIAALWQWRLLDQLELVYLSVILGILAGRLGLLG